MGFLKGLKEILRICTFASTDLGARALRLSKDGKRLLWTLCTIGFGILSITDDGKKDTPKEQPSTTPPPVHEAPQPKRRHNVRRTRQGNHNMRNRNAPGQQPPQAGFVFYVTSHGREVRIISLNDTIDV